MHTLALVLFFVGLVWGALVSAMTMVTIGLGHDVNPRVVAVYYVIAFFFLAAAAFAQLLVG